MKIKTDYVTNSSTSSFVVMGVTIEISEIENVLDNLEKKSNSNYDNLTRLLKDSDLKFCSIDSDYEYMVGIYYTNMKEDETLGQFKQRVRDQLLKHLWINKNVYHIEEAWEDR